MDSLQFLIKFIGLCMIALPFVFGNVETFNDDTPYYNPYSEQNVLDNSESVGKQFNYIVFMLLKLISFSICFFIEIPI